MASIGNVTFACEDPAALAEFWAAAIEYELEELPPGLHAPIEAVSGDTVSMDASRMGASRMGAIALIADRPVDPAPKRSNSPSPES